MALKVIDGKQTEKGALWWHPETASFSSQNISLAALREFKGSVKLVVKKNVYYKKGSTRPNYVFWLRDSKAEDALELGLEDVPEYDGDSEDDERRYTYSELMTCIEGACLDGQHGYDPGDCIPRDYLGYE